MVDGWMRVDASIGQSWLVDVCASSSASIGYPGGQLSCRPPWAGGAHEEERARQRTGGGGGGHEDDVGAKAN